MIDKVTLQELLFEARTEQSIGYHATTGRNAWRIYREGVLRANPKSARWTISGTGIGSLQDSVYLELSPTKAIRYYGGDDGSSGLVVVQFTEKSALADPQYDIRGFVWHYLQDNGFVKDVADPFYTKNARTPALIDKLVAEYANLAEEWVAKHNAAFLAKFHGLLSKNNPQVPNKVDLFQNLLLLTVKDRFSDSIFSGATPEEKRSISEEYHKLLAATADSYKGFKRTASTAMRLTSDVGMSGRNKIIGIMTAGLGKRSWDSDSYDRNGAPDLMNETFNVIYGDPAKLQQLTGLKCRNINRQFNKFEDPLPPASPTPEKKVRRKKRDPQSSGG